MYTLVWQLQKIENIIAFYFCEIVQMSCGELSR